MSSRSGSRSAPLTTASLFSGIGGIEAGLGTTGAATVASLCERWDPARAVLAAHFPGIAMHDNVTTLADFGGAALVTAGFPCTDLSQAGMTQGLEGLNSSLVLGVLNLVRVHRPDWVLLENVPNMLHLGQGRAMGRIVLELEDAGYRWAYRVLDSRFTGLAQRRRRVILLASREEDPAPLLLSEDVGVPERPADATAYGFSWTEGNRGLGWAVGAVPTLKGGTTVRVPSPPAVWLPGAEPGLQIVRPSIEAAETLQGFPAGWTAAAPERDRLKLVGNAVSTRVAEWVGDQLGRRAEEAQTVWSDELLPDGAPWPRAARGGNGKRWRAHVSEFPRHPSPDQRQDLATVLTDHGCDPLSYRATRGFRDRLICSRLRYRPDFLTALDTHIARYAP